MADEGKGVSPWVWIIGAALIILLAAYFVSVVPEDGEVPVGNTEVVGTQQVDPMMLGVWRSLDDPKFSREFKADGTVTDTYAGDDSAIAMGTWMVVDPAKEPAEALGAPAENLGMTILKITFSDGLILYFSVNALNETSLVLTHLSGTGNILTFTKVQH